MHTRTLCCYKWYAFVNVHVAIPRKHTAATSDKIAMLSDRTAFLVGIRIGMALAQIPKAGNGRQCISFTH